MMCILDQLITRYRFMYNTRANAIHFSVAEKFCMKVFLLLYTYYFFCISAREHQLQILVMQHFHPVAITPIQTTVIPLIPQ